MTLFGRTRIAIDYARCGDGVGVDPRECGACLRICEPAVFLLHQTLGAVEEDPFDPKKWRVTPLWPSLCTRCGACVTACPQGAMTVRPAPKASQAAEPPHARAADERPCGAATARGGEA